ncbi:MAG: DUF3592 domain-containing protein [Phycisphaeraceae bacterium]|nr:MAG: DUF3592 domain-containing protein [Phycisphaeraceae bacterium]
MRYERGGDGAGCGVFGAFVLALMLGIALALWWGPGLRRVASAPGWPETPARVTASAVVSHGRHIQNVDVIADVEYEVAGTIYQAYALEIASWVDPSTGAGLRPRVGSALPLRYDPANPARCSLVHAWSSVHTWKLSISLAPWAVVLLTLPVLVWRFRQATRGVLITDDE